MKQSRQCIGPWQLASEHFCLISISSVEFSWVQLWFSQVQTGTSMRLWTWPTTTRLSSGQWRRDIWQNHMKDWGLSQISCAKKYHTTTGSSKNRTIFLITMVMNIIKSFFFSIADMCKDYIQLPSAWSLYETPFYIVTTSNILHITYVWLIKRAEKYLLNSQINWEW